MVDITKVSSLTVLGATSGKQATTGTGTTGTDTTKQSDTDKAEGLKTQFLNILLTQMQNQNPLDPMDTKELTSQLAQFSSLEQQINTNSKLDSMLTAMQSSANTSAFGYIGQTAELSSKDTVVESGKVDWQYTVDSAADTINIKISDASGKTIYEKDDKNIASGTYSLNAASADFTDPVTEGQVLTLTVTAKDVTGAAIRSDVSTNVKVDGIESGPEGISLRSGGLMFALDDVLRFKSTTTTTTPTA